MGAAIYRTDASGTIIVRASADGTYTVDAVPSVTALPYDPTGPDRDCGEFNTQTEAQAFFGTAGANDPHRLDSDGDGVVCESLP